jgi:hypothetical protein
MAKLPSSILKQLTARAKDKTKKIKSLEGTDASDTVLIKAHDKTGNYYLMYSDAIRSFLVAGYSENAAEKYIKTWNEYDMTEVWYLDTYKIIGFNTVEIEKAML